MKKRLVALVLCVMMLLGCTAARADYNYFFPDWLSKFDFSESTCRSSSFNRSALAALAILDYSTSVSNAYEVDFSQPVYVSNFPSDSGDSSRYVDFFTKSGIHVRLFINSAVVLYDVDTDIPSYVKTINTMICDWSYEAPVSEILEVYETLAEVMN